MALERVGLGAVLTFESAQAIRAMGAASRAVGQLSQAEDKAVASTSRLDGAIGKLGQTLGTVGSKMASAANQLGSAFRTAGLMALPVSAGMGVIIKQAADFEQAMGDVRAVLFDTSDEGFAPLIAKAKDLGRTTQYSATEAAGGMLELARAGFTTQEIMDSVGGVLAMAAAEGMDLATAAEIAGNTIRSMGLNAAQTNGVANVLALTSARTSTDIVGLGHAMKFAAPQAYAMGISLPEVSAALGVLGDAGLKGTLAGTSFVNMLVKLGKPTDLAAKFTKQLGAAIYETKDGSLDMVKTLASFAEGLKNVHSKTQKATMISEIFGLRGQKAVNAFSQALETGKIHTLIAQLTEEFGKAEGAAQKMAETRLDTFLGKMTLAKNAANALAIEMGEAFLGPMKDEASNWAGRLRDISIVMEQLNKGTFDQKKANEEYGQTTVAVAKGIKEGLDEVANSIIKVRQEFGKLLGEQADAAGPEGIQSTTKMITMIAAAVAIAAPVLLVLGGLFYFITGVVIPVFSAAFTLLSMIGGAVTGAFALPILAAIAAIVVAWVFLSDYIEAFWASLIEWAGPGITFMLEGFQYLAASVSEFFVGMYHTVKDTFAFLAPLLIPIFQLVGGVIGGILSGIGYAIGLLTIPLTALFTMLKHIVRVGIGFLLTSLQGLVLTLVKLADVIGAGGLVPEGMRKFAEQPYFKLFSETDKPTTESAREELVKNTAEQVALQKQAQVQPPEVKAEVKLEDKRCIEVSNEVKLDGKKVSKNQAKHKQEIYERAGFKAQPWQRRVALEQGAAPTGGRG
jgi:TP901 family phage tail tape measure protein